MFRRALFLALLLPAIQACDPADPCEVAATVPASMTLGTGQDRLRQLQDGDHVDTEWGMQGGQHIWVGVATEGVAPGRKPGLGTYEEGPMVVYSLWSADGQQIGDGMTNQPMDGSPESAELAGQELFVWGGWEYTDGPTPDLSELTIRAELVDRCGTELIEEVRVTADL